MGPMNDDDEGVTRTVAEGPVKSESKQGDAAVAEHGDEKVGVEERLALGLEEAGYGYGV